ncbi:MAG TPA: hypothetical protein VGR10_01835 [Thermoleophilaceae bacterium]|nr:hypothetical protein [Thermoleophilaceae bacterium]
MRPMTFWALVAGAIFAAMTLLLAFGEEQTGVIGVIASVAWWGTGLLLVVFGLVAIARYGRQPAALRKPAARSGRGTDGS